MEQLTKHQVLARLRARDEGGIFKANDRPKSKKTVTLRLYDDLQEKLEKEAQSRGISIAELIIEKIDSYSG